jgi:hypothetical protein
MRILIDECLDWRLCRSLGDHYCVSVPKMGWSGLANGALMREAEQEFDVFITGDRNLSFQQTGANFKIAVIVLHAESIQLHHTRPLMPQVLGILPALKPGQVVDVHPRVVINRRRSRPAHNHQRHATIAGDDFGLNSLIGR